MGDREKDMVISDGWASGSMVCEHCGKVFEGVRFRYSCHDKVEGDWPECCNRLTKFGDDWNPESESDREKEIQCSRCGKHVSSPVPLGVVVRAWVECPECILNEDQMSDREKEIEIRLAAQREIWVETVKSAADRLGGLMIPSASEVAWLLSLAGQLAVQVGNYSHLRGQWAKERSKGGSR